VWTVVVEIVEVISHGELCCVVVLWFGFGSMKFVSLCLRERSELCFSKEKLNYTFDL
jgi:hypothetical protein